MLKKIILFFIICISTFALKIDNLDFDKEILLGQKESQTYTLINSKNYPLRYTLSIEDEKKNIEVVPKTLLIPQNSKKDFSIFVLGDEKGAQRYFLILEEEGLNLENNGSQAKIKMKYRIEQKYFVK